MGQSLKVCEAIWIGGRWIDIVLSVVTLEICQNGIEAFSREEMTVLGLISLVTPLNT
jgi:hypothetical protein